MWFRCVPTVLLCATPILAHFVPEHADGADVAKTPNVASEKGDDTQAPLAERIATIAEAQRERSKQFYDELRSIAKERKELSATDYGAKVDAANRKYNDELRPAAKSLIELIKDNRTHPEMMDGIILLNGEMSHSLNVDPQLVKIVLEDQLASPKIGRLCFQLRYANNDQVAETILKAAAEKHPSREVQGQATFALGEYYRQTARDDWGRPLKPDESATLLASAEKQFSEVIKNFTDIKSPDGQKKLSELATSSLSRIQNIPNLRVGKPGPEVSGTDLDGRPAKLSDYRGKITVMVFWASWCGPCMAMVPHERELVERMKDKPFILLGINCGDELETAKETAKAKQMHWPSLWDGGTNEGPIQSAYNVLHWPTVYVLDSKGVIRYLEPEGKELDAAVDTLLAEMEQTQNGKSTPKP